MESNFDIVEQRIEMVAELTPWVQIDVIDLDFGGGKKTFELELLRKLSVMYDKMLFDIHLMVKEPSNWINKCAFVNASRVIGQVEMMSDRTAFVKEVKDLGIEAGIAFDVETEIEEIPEETDVVLIMGRKAGFGNMELDDNTYVRIRKAVEYRERNKMKYKIGVDGGINTANIEKLKSEGVEVFYCTGAIYNGNVVENLEKLNQYAK